MSTTVPNYKLSSTEDNCFVIIKNSQDNKNVCLRRIKQTREYKNKLCSNSHNQDQNKSQIVKSLKTLKVQNFHTRSYKKSSIILFINLIILFFISNISVSYSYSTQCPPVNLIYRLVTPNGGSSMVNAHHSEALKHSSHSSNHTTPECDCSSLQEGGWEINCYSNHPSSDTAGTSLPSGLDDDSSGFLSKNPEFADYNIDYNILEVWFTIKYLVGRQVTIVCDQRAPIFKPALFQGKLSS